MKLSKSDLSRPKVLVKIPEVRLQLRDLGYLRSLAMPDSPKCHVGTNVTDRLRFLDLIGRAKVPKSEAVLRQIAEEVKGLRTKLDIAVNTGEWAAVSAIAYELKRAAERTEPIECDVLTERGRQLLRNGEATVKIRKVGCV